MSIVPFYRHGLTLELSRREKITLHETSPSIFVLYN
jgi:hypothetical protein